MQPSAPSTYMQIATLDNAIEAQLLGSILTERGIPHRIQSFYDTAYDGLFQMHKGWGSLYAPIEHQDQILEILKTLRDEDLSLMMRPE